MNPNKNNINHRFCNWVLLLLIVVIGIFSSPVASAARQKKDSSSVPEVSDILITQTFDVWYFSGYLQQHQDSNGILFNEKQYKDQCCLMINEGYKELINKHLYDVAVIPQTKGRKIIDICNEQIAPVPKFLSSQEDNINININSEMWLADYTLVVMVDHNHPNHNDKINVRQYHYLPSSEEQKMKEMIIPDQLSPSPLILPQSAISKKTPTPGLFLQAISSSNFRGISSNMSPDGGMHRIVTHNIMSSKEADEQHHDDEKVTYYMVWMIPNGLFVDIEQFLVDDDSNGEYKIHYARICDIEQPSFDSPQHIIVIEFDKVKQKQLDDDDDDDDSIITKIQTRLHLRYPIPGTKRVQWVEPHGFEIHKRKHKGISKSSPNSTKQMTIVNIIGSYPSPSYFKIHDWKIASGNDDDYIWVQFVTVTACLLGVFIMLRDISYVSKWDCTN